MTTLTATGNVSLTSPTNWSPAQTPVPGDDLIIGPWTLTLDADMTLGSVTFVTNGSGRLAISGTNRTVNCTNGWNAQGISFSGIVISTTLIAGMNVTLRGTWYSTSTNGTINGIASSTGGNLTLATIGDDPSGVLFADPFASNATRVITASWSGGTLTTIGRFNMPFWTAASTLVTMSGGSWIHSHTGMSLLGNGGHVVFSQSGSALLNWSGDLTSASTTQNLINFTGSGTTQIIGTLKRTVGGGSVWNTGSIGCILSLSNAASAVINIIGVLCVLATSRCASIISSGGGGCRINWRSQSRSIPSTDAVVIFSGQNTVLDMTDLQISNAGKFMYHEISGASVVVDSSTVLTNTTTSAQACIMSNSGALDGKVINLASDAPTLPTVSHVAGGTVYGYAASPMTGTGVISDPAVVASAVGTAMESLSVNALKRFVTVNTGETAATDGSVAKLAQGGTVDLSSVLAHLPTSGRAVAEGGEVTLSSATLTALFADVDTAALVASIVAQFNEATDLPVDTLAALASSRTVAALASLISDAAAAKAAAQSADTKLSAGRLSRVDRLPDVNPGTTGGLALHGETGGGAGDAEQETLIEVQEAVDSIAVALAGAKAITPTGRVAQGGTVTAYIGDDFRVRSGTALPIPVSDPAAALKTKLEAIGLGNLFFGAAPKNGPVGAITGTVSGITAAAGITTISIEISNCGVDLMPGSMPYQIQQSVAQESEFDDFVELEGTLILNPRTVAVRK